MTFQGDSGVTPDLGTNRVEANWYGSGTLVTIIPGSLKPDPRDPETETENLETEKRVHRIHGTLETGLHKDASQPGGPLKGRRRTFETSPQCYSQEWPQHINTAIRICANK